MLTRAWRNLPWDGAGWSGVDDPSLAGLRRCAAVRWQQQFPALIRPALSFLSLSAWPFALAMRTWSLGRALRLPVAARGRLFAECLRNGSSPLDAYAWRAVFGTSHPLPPRAAGLVLAILGTPEGRTLLADKLATADCLAQAGIRVPLTRGLCRRGQPAHWPEFALLGEDLFLKPRHGSGGRGAFALRKSQGRWQLNGRAVEPTALQAVVVRLSRQDDLLVQERLCAAPSLLDLASDGRAPVLRLGTARMPGGAPFLHSALLSIPVQGRHTRHFLEGAVHAPINLATGALAPGILLGSVQRPVERLDWNGAIVAGRHLPSFFEAADLAVRAMAAVPAMPLVHWDVILTGHGPVFLEGNSSGNWLLANLASVPKLDAGPLVPLLVRWQEALLPRPS